MNDWSKLTPGELIRYDIRSARDGKPLLVRAGTPITPQLIEALNRFETIGEKLVVSPAGSDSVIEQPEIKTKKNEEFKMAESLKNDAIDAAKTIFSENTPLATMQSVAEDIAIEITDSIINVGEHAGICIQDLRISDEYTYQHSVDVSILGAALAKILGFDKDAINDVAQAGLLHDVGKRRIPIEILNKPDKLSPEEFEIIKLHPTYAYVDLKNLPNLSEKIKRGVYEHHEKSNGKGYPKGLLQSEISSYGQILSIVDVYDALTSKRPYKSAMTSANTIGIMTRMMHGFNIKYFGRFLCEIIPYPINSDVICNDGDVWRVVGYNADDSVRPVLYNSRTGVVADLSLREFEHISIFGEDSIEMRVKYIDNQNKKYR